MIEAQAEVSRFRLREELTQMGKTMAQVVAERGRAEGEVVGLRRAVEGVLESRFGPLPADVEAALARADLDTLDGWLRRAATAPSLEAIGIEAP